MSGVIVHYGVKGMKWGVRKKEAYRKHVIDTDKAFDRYSLARDRYMDTVGPKPPKRWYNRLTGKNTVRANKYYDKVEKTYQKWLKSEEGSKLNKEYNKALRDQFKLAGDAYKHGVKFVESQHVFGKDVKIAVKKLTPNEEKRVKEAIDSHLDSAEIFTYMDSPWMKSPDLAKGHMWDDNEQHPYDHR